MEIPICVQASHHTSKTLWLLAIYLLVTAAGPLRCHKPPAPCVSPWPFLHRALLYVTFAPERAIMANVGKWSIVRIWTSYPSNSASISDMQAEQVEGNFGEILLESVTISYRKLSSYLNVVIQLRCFKTGYLIICSLEDFTFIIHLLVSLKHS